jgi:serine/threonine protein kinase
VQSDRLLTMCMCMCICVYRRCMWMYMYMYIHDCLCIYVCVCVCVCVCVSVCADIFSFGIVLCEMICKCEPSSEFLHRQARDFFALDFAELQEAVPHDCPESLEALALQCCQTEPSSRPSASECIEWLQVRTSVHIICSFYVCICLPKGTVC